jgi:hypothetical protein
MKAYDARYDTLNNSAAPVAGFQAFPVGALEPYTRKAEASAVQAPDLTFILRDQGAILVVQAGEWLVVEDGAVSTLSDADFKARYAPAEAPLGDT